ncbi:MAG: MarP family serine protease [Propionibacteriaceae bacterium]|nr:MarP family serine protease [Propionibacteriaceae bacterium]
MTIPLLLDLVLVLLIMGNALRGWSNGIVAGTLGLAGMLTGVLVALWAVPLLMERFDAFPVVEPWRSLTLIAAVVVGAEVGRGILGGISRRIIRPRAVVGTVDGVLGFIAAALVSALLAGVLGAAVKPVVPLPWAKAMNESRVLGTIERVLPGQSQRWASRLTDALNATGLPGAFSGLVPEPILPADAPEAADATTEAVQKAAGSVVKVGADACSRALSGSGWVVAPQRIVTNAHVIAGASAVTVQVAGAGAALEARVVAFDPDLDLAILDVPGLSAPALERDGELVQDEAAVVAGFPLGGPYSAEAARNRGEINALGVDIYGGKGVNREVYALYATARPGNSGGPLLTTEGRVAGTIFARSQVDANTAYALTDAATDELLDGAAAFSETVGAGSCTR